MQEYWVLSVKTSLPERAERYDKLKTNVSVFDGFEKARDAMRAFIHDVAFSENTMFDGAGHLKTLEDYMAYYFEEDEEEDDEEEYDDFLGKTKLSAISALLARAFSGEDVEVPMDSIEAENGMIGVHFEKNRIRFYEDYDGRLNGFEPVLATNIFSMKKEQDYYLYIEDLFGQDENASVLYIDLTRCYLDEITE